MMLVCFNLSGQIHEDSIPTLRIAKNVEQIKSPYFALPNLKDPNALCDSLRSKWKLHVQTVLDTPTSNGKTYYGRFSLLISKFGNTKVMLDKNPNAFEREMFDCFQNILTKTKWYPAKSLRNHSPIKCEGLVSFMIDSNKTLVFIDIEEPNTGQILFECKGND